MDSRLRGNDSVGLKNNSETSHGLPIPLPRLRLEPADGKRRGLSECWKREFRSRPYAALIPKDKAAAGVICFGYFALDKQRKVTRMSRASDC